METNVLITNLKSCVKQIPELKGLKEGFHHPKVKSWKTRLEELLVDGGTTCVKSLESLRKMKRSFGGNDFIRKQSFQTHLDALHSTLTQAIQTIEVFGRPEDKKIHLDWATPKKNEPDISGYIKIGDQKVATGTITIQEVLSCFVALIKDSNDLTNEMREDLDSHMCAIIENDLFKPFLNQTFDKLLQYWDKAEHLD